MKLIYMS